MDIVEVVDCQCVWGVVFGVGQVVEDFYDSGCSVGGMGGGML